MRHLIFTVLMCFFLFNFLSSQTLIVDVTPVTCVENGELSWFVEDIPAQLAQATLTYEVEQLSSATVIQLGTSTDITALASGLYEVSATFSSNGQDRLLLTETVLVPDVSGPLLYNYTVTPDPCKALGQVKVDILTGQIASMNVTGPLTFTTTDLILQALPAGPYSVKVFDLCGGQSKFDFSIKESTLGFDAVVTETDDIWHTGLDFDCDEILTNVRFNNVTQSEILDYPLPFKFTFTVYPPNGGSPEVITEVRPTLTPFLNTFMIPWYPGEQYDYDLLIEDNCGNTLDLSHTIYYEKEAGEIDMYMEDCSYCHTISVSHTRGDVYLDYTSAPVGFNPADFIEYYPGPMPLEFNADDLITICSDNQSAPVGDYTLEISDDCGAPITVFYTVTESIELAVVEEESAQACNSDEGSVYLEYSDEIEFIEILSAPTTYTGSDDITSLLSSDSQSVTVENLPAGEYTFRAVSECGLENIHEVSIVGLSVDFTDYEIISSCESFDLYFIEDITNGGNFEDIKYFLYHDGIVLKEIQNDRTLTGILLSGDFDIVRVITPSVGSPCTEVIHTFDYTADGSNFDLAYRFLDYTNFNVQACAGEEVILTLVPYFNYPPLINGTINYFSQGSYQTVMTNEDGVAEIKFIAQNDITFYVTSYSKTTGSGVNCFGNDQEYKGYLAFDVVDCNTCIGISADDGCSLTEDRVDPFTCQIINTPINVPSNNCWDDYNFDYANCMWVNSGVAPTRPAVVNCWDAFSLDNNCTWINVGTPPVKPARVNCWDSYQLDLATCSWSNLGRAPARPDNLACNEIATFSQASCSWITSTDASIVSGCTDPDASNYNPNATCEDGSCFTGTVDCAVYNFEDFESGMGIWLDGGEDSYRYFGPTPDAQHGSHYIRLRDGNGIASSIFTEMLPLNNANEMRVDFEYFTMSMEYGDTFLLEASFDGGITFNIIRLWVSGVDFTNDMLINESVTIKKNFNDRTVLRFRSAADTNMDIVYLNDIKLTVCFVEQIVQEACNAEILAFHLVDQQGNTLSTISQDVTLCAADLKGDLLKVRAAVSGAHESMRFSIDGPTGYYENVKNFGVYESDFFFSDIEGAYTVTALLYGEDDQLGDVCDEATFTFNVNNDSCVETGGAIPGADDCEDFLDFEDFENSLGIWIDGGADVHHNFETGQGANNSDGRVRLRDDTEEASSLFTQTLDLELVSDVSVSFVLYTESMELGERFLLEYSLNDGKDWLRATSWVSGEDFENEEFYYINYSFRERFNDQSRLRFRCQATSNNDQVYLDDIALHTCAYEGLTSGDDNDNNNAYVTDDGDQEVVTYREQKAEVELEKSIYPNPVLESLIIKGLGDGENYRVLDTKGKTITQSKVNKLDVYEWESGIYFIQFSDGSSQKFLKI